MASEDELRDILARVVCYGDGAVLGAAAALLAAGSWLYFRSHRDAYARMQAAPLVPIDGLASLVREQQHQGRVVFVRGRVAPLKEHAALQARDSADAGVYIERTQTYLYNQWMGLSGHWRSPFSWSKITQQVGASTAKVPFVLTGPGGDYVHVNIDRAKRHPLPLDTTFHKLHPVQSSPSVFLQALLGRYPIGVLEEEKILPQGKALTAVGKIVTSDDGDASIEPCSSLPYYLWEHGPDELLMKVAAETGIRLICSVFLAAAAVGILSYSAYKNWRKRQIEAEEVRLRSQHQQGEEDEEEEQRSEEVLDGELCVVCLQRRRRSAFIPCGHNVCCIACSRRVNSNVNNKCPVCRQQVHGFIRIYA